jgi:hypothetical protein
MGAIFSFILVLLFLLPLAFAVDNLSLYGFEGIELVGSNKLGCETLSFDFRETFSSESEGILSIKADFVGKSGDNSFVSVEINGKKQIVWPEYFFCDGSCWARVSVPNLKEVPTIIELCIASGGATQSAKIYKESTIGFYTSPVLSVETTAPQQIFLGQRAQLQTTVRNTGSAEADFFIQFVSEDRRAIMEITSFDIVDGDPSARAIIKPNESKTFTYFIKPTNASSYNLPSSVLIFTNIFGEKQYHFSNHPSMNVLDPEQVSIIIIGNDLAEDVFNFKLKVINNWSKPFLGKISILPKDLVEKQVEEISLPANSEQEFSFSTKELLPGKYSISALIADSNNAYSTASVSFEVKKQDFSFEILLSIFGVIIAVAIFVGIYFWKE